MSVYKDNENKLQMWNEIQVVETNEDITCANFTNTELSDLNVCENTLLNSEESQVFSKSNQSKKPLPRPRVKIAKVEHESLLHSNVLSSPYVEDERCSVDKKHMNDDDQNSKSCSTSPKNYLTEGIIDEKVNNEDDNSTGSKNGTTIKDLKEEQEQNIKPISENNLQKIIGITVHQSDCLKTHILVKHPLVKVSLLYANTGKYLKKSNPQIPAVNFYENDDMYVILPLMTKSFDFKHRRSLIPVWEELLLFNEDIQYILQEDEPVIIMFEILDFVNFSVAGSQYKKLGPEGGWHKVAWAFLKPLGSNGHLNTEKKIRLQLYKPLLSGRHNTASSAYLWWAQQIWEPYPSTLYVTVKGVPKSQHFLPDVQSQGVLQAEKTGTTLPLTNIQEEQIIEKYTGVDDAITKSSGFSCCPVWSRLPSQSCKIPNEIALSIAASSKGCFLSRFSHSGLLLACTRATESSFSISLYSIPDGKEFTVFFGHQAIIYDLCWCSNDTLLLSGSGDCTVCIWDVEGRKANCLQVLPHPSFVYSVKFHGHRNWLLATGCNDHVIRFWVRQHKADSYELIQELEGHRGFVNSLCFIQQNTLVSADSEGLLLLWECDKNSFSRKNIIPWTRHRDISLRELKGTIINKVALHPGGQRLLVHSRDNVLRMLDISTGIVIQWFRGVINNRVQSSCCISPCGSWVFAASEDGSVCVWNADTGELTALYSGLSVHETITSVDYHPYENMVSFSSHGHQSGVVVCVYNKLSSGCAVGLQLLKSQGDANKKREELKATCELTAPHTSDLNTKKSIVFSSLNTNYNVDFNNLIKKMDAVLTFKPHISIEKEEYQ